MCSIFRGTAQAYKQARNRLAATGCGTGQELANLDRVIRGGRNGGAGIMWGALAGVVGTESDNLVRFGGGPVGRGAPVQVCSPPAFEFSDRYYPNRCAPTLSSRRDHWQCRSSSMLPSVNGNRSGPHPRPRRPRSETPRTSCPRLGRSTGRRGPPSVDAVGSPQYVRDAQICRFSQRARRGIGGSRSSLGLTKDIRAVREPHP